MSDVIVSQLAESIGTSVERLLKQMEDAGLPQRKPAESVSDEQKFRSSFCVSLMALETERMVGQKENYTEAENG